MPMGLLAAAGGETTTGVMDKVLNAVGSVLDFAGTILDRIVENPLLLFILAAGLVPIGLEVFSNLRRTAKG